MSTKAWVLVFVYLAAFVPLVDPGRPSDHKVTILLMLGIFTVIHYMPGRRVGRQLSSEAQYLHKQLLELVNGDEVVVRRLVVYERRTSRAIEEQYRSAITRIKRDRV